MRNRIEAKRAKKAVVLLSGGLDSAVTLYYAKSQGFSCTCLIFDYGQRHCREINAARDVAKAAGCSCQILKICLPWKGSSLLDKGISIRATSKELKAKTIPLTYVPGRNIIFLSFALSFAEAISAGAVFIGAHAQDYSGYPDCRPDFFKAFRRVASSGTKAGACGSGIEIKTPLINKGKADIIKLGAKLKVPFSLTWSCYKGAKKPCGVCDSCYYRKKGFKEAGIKDL
jgi:7-cyano-7-deazaguanine synthase